MRMGTPQPRQLCKWKLLHLENGLYPVLSGVFPTTFWTQITLFYLLNLIMSKRVGKNGCSALCIKISPDQITGCVKNVDVFRNRYNSFIYQ